MKKVGVLGSGAVGKTLAKGFSDIGFTTTIASRNPATREALAAELPKSIKVDTNLETVKNNELIVLAVKGYAAKEALVNVGIENLSGKTVIDATNPISQAAPVKGVLQYFTDINRSLMEELQELIPDAHFVKAFSCVGSPHMINPNFESKPTMFICGNNDSAKSEVTEILTKFGWETADMGAAESARAIEPLAMLWCIPGFRNNQWTHAFKMVK